MISKNKTGGCYVELAGAPFALRLDRAIPGVVEKESMAFSPSPFFSFLPPLQVFICGLRRK